MTPVWGRRAALSCGFALAALLVGCATAPVPAVDGPWTSGRLAVRVEAFGERPANSLNANFELRGDGRRGELRLSSPLGSVLAATRWSEHEAVLDDGRSQTRYADLDALSQAALGEVLPLAALPDWLAGRPWAGAPAAAGEGGFRQLGWDVDLRQFGQGLLEARRNTAPVVTVRVRLERP